MLDIFVEFPCILLYRLHVIQYLLYRKEGVKFYSRMETKCTAFTGQQYVLIRQSIYGNKGLMLKAHI